MKGLPRRADPPPRRRQPTTRLPSGRTVAVKRSDVV